MSIHRFGILGDTTEIFEIWLKNEAGARCNVITHGAAVQDLVVPLAKGGSRRVVLGFPTLAGYLADANYIGVTAGRYASRITRGRLRIDGHEHTLSRNIGDHHLHGGAVGFSARPWRILSADEDSVMLALTSPDGDQGYPGALEVRCLYRLLSPATLRIVMTATADAPTVVNLAHHSYFCLLPGYGIREHLMQVNAKLHVAFDADTLPSGEILRLAGGPADFRALRPIGAEQTYDMAFVLDRTDAEPMQAATLVAPDRSLAMDLRTTEPCLIFYDGGHIAPGAAGLDGAPYGRHAGLCLEPMRFPDAPNHPSFPLDVLRPGGVYRQVTEYRFRAAEQ